MTYLQNSIRPLIQKLRNSEPDTIEIRAIAATLHAFYNGVEHTFLLISKYFQEEIGRSHTWHRNLLVHMSEPTQRRGAVVLGETVDELSEFSAFRHFSRHAYPMRLKWSLIRPLVERLGEISKRFIRDNP